MANAGRSLEFSLLSDSTGFDLGDAAGDLEDLGKAADDTGKDLGDLAGDARDAGRKVSDQLSSDARDAVRSLDQLGDAAKGVDLEDKLGRDAKEAARKVDDAFDTIARASRQSSSDVRRETRDMRDTISEVGDEARDTSREMLQSFGSVDDFGDAFQEITAIASEKFGPLGLAFGGAAIVGLQMWRENAEQLQQLVDDMTADMIENAGQLSETFINTKIQEMATNGELETLKELVNQYQVAGVTFADMAKARAGDADAIARVTAALDAETERRKANADEQMASEAAVAALTDQIDGQRQAAELAREATANYQEAVSNAGGEAATQAHVAGAAWDDLRANLGRPVMAQVGISSPASWQLQKIRLDLQRYYERNPITIPVRPGQRPVRDVF